MVSTVLAAYTSEDSKLGAVFFFTTPTSSRLACQSVEVWWDAVQWPSRILRTRTPRSSTPYRSLGLCHDVLSGNSYANRTDVEG